MHAAALLLSPRRVVAIRYRYALACALALCFAPGRSTVQAADTKSLVEGNNAFALDLYAQLKGAQGNLFFSPYSISSCLGMAYAGARGQTEEEMARVLHFGIGQNQLHTDFGELQRGLNAVATTQGQGQIQLSVANALWTQQGHPFVPDFLKLTTQNYQAGIRQVDFRTAAEPVRKEINQWVEQKTHNRITNILPPGSLSDLTRLVLVNAIYFKGAWSAQFRETETSKMPFHLSSTNQTEVSMMHHFDEVNYVATTNFQAVEFTYRGGALSMMIFLPRHVAGCGQMESWLTAAFIQQWVGQMKKQRVEIFLPKFKLELMSELSGILQKMGMKQAFEEGVADFSGIDQTKYLYVSGIFHKAWVEVSEEGTEAAAATAIATPTAVGIGHEPPPSPIFRADHPFIFFIRDRHSGSLLFMGRLANPR